MNDDLILRNAELAENPTPRVPVCLALDVSGSMAGKKMDELNLAVRQFFNSVRADEMASISAEIAVVTFGSNATKVVDFSSIDRQTIPTLSAGGYTAMGEGVNMSLDLLDQAKRIYSQRGLDYFQPWLVLMTDGEPQGESEVVTNSAISRCQELVRKNKLTVIPVAIGDDANIKILSQFSPNLDKILNVQSIDFKRFFAWLAKSMNTVSLTNPGDKQSISFGANEYKKMSKDFHSLMSR
jgi:uncharacterized protein YegL